ncbi:MAG: FimV/HubP family polar landmark protein [Pseudomonadota bacterium]
MHRSTMLAIALWAAVPALAQDPSGVTPVAVQGILISPNGRSALIGGELTREGEAVHGARVVEISETSVVLHRGDSVLTVPVGGSAYWTNAVPIPAIAKREPVPEPRMASPRSAHYATPGQRTVLAGETLSEIAAEHLTPGMTLFETMLGIFAANRHAFGDDMDQLLAGATLRLPAADELKVLAAHPGAITKPAVVPTAAPHQALALEEQTPPAGQQKHYGPVQPGETLSKIAFRLVHPNVTTDQLMVAIFELNPGAFSNNINRLRAGAVLRLPADAELSQLSSDYAAGEVRRQMDEWRNGRTVLAQAR